ncbi:MAG: hypothetical protein U9Q21_01380 [Candidatus Auribacterota bacterium]|nr:hypothetical protein [Candidatus Auribacterota bacterium]
MVVEVYGGSVIFEGTSSFFSLYYQTINGVGNIHAQGPEITNDFSFTNSGKAEGTYFVDANNLTIELFFSDVGSMQAVTNTSSTVTLITFTGGGWLKQHINVGDGFEGLTGIFMFFNADYIFLYIEDDRPEPEPHLRLVSVSTDGNEVAVCVKNTGDADLLGEAIVVAGLSYRAHYWVPESMTNYSRQSLGNGSIAAGETFTFFFVLPDVSEESFRSFVTARGLWTSFNYPDPPEDCIGITLSIGQEKVFAFLPLNYKASLTIESMSIEEGEVILAVKNSGIFYIAGDVLLTASLSSQENYSVPSAWIEFSQLSLGNGVLAPGDIFTFRFGLPEIPTWALQDLMEQEGAADQGYVRIRLLIGNQAVFVLLPITT